jgi:hypothetical protein
VIDHWYALIPGFNTSNKEFYEAVEKELKDRKVPGLEMFQVDFAEGGIMSSKREYLRMSRERLVFDICAAPFGTAFFFSCRFGEIPAVIQLWQLLVILVAFTVCVPLSLVICARIFGVLTPFVWPLGWIVLIVLAIYVLRNAVAMGLKDLDAALIKSPIVGPIYERFFRKETYYRQDTRLMYRDTVNDVVKAKVEEATGAKGITLIKFNDYSPILGELYKPTNLQPKQTPPAA